MPRYSLFFHDIYLFSDEAESASALLSREVGEFRSVSSDETLTVRAEGYACRQKAKMTGEEFRVLAARVWGSEWVAKLSELSEKCMTTVRRWGSDRVDATAIPGLACALLDCLARERFRAERGPLKTLRDAPLTVTDPGPKLHSTPGNP